MTTPTPPVPSRSAPADPRRFVEASGTRIALFGDEWGTYEAWAWPFKLVDALRVDLERAAEPLGPWALARRVEVTPRGFAFELAGGGLRARQEVFALAERAAVAVVTTYLEGPAPLELAARFRCDLRPVWPAGLGGESARVDPETGLFCLTEERGRVAALVGGDGFALDAADTDHGVPTEAVRLVAPLAPGEARVLVLAAATLDPDPLSEEARLGRGQAATGFARAERNVTAARALHAEVRARHRELAAEEDARWRALYARVPRLTTDDARLDDAYAWALAALQRAWVEVDGVGRGLVAGIGPSKGGARPGYAWFFDGDALVAARALTRAGEREAVRDVLRFAASHQREDGKLMHELTLSARLCPWLEEYPYAYYKGLNAADFVVTLGDHVRVAGDLDVARELWDHARRALAWCRGCAGADGLMENARAGIAAVEAGPLSDRIEVEVFLNAAYLAALEAGVRVAEQLGEAADAARFAGWRAEAAAGYERLWSEARGRYAFGRLDDGSLLDDLTAYHGYALERGLGTPERALATARQLSSPTLVSDWGARMFATDSAVYDPAHYNTGAVFPYLTGFCARGLYRHGLTEQASQLALEQAALTHFGGLGFLEEHLTGDTATVPARGVPHQIFSSSQVVETAHVGLFGLREDAVEGRVALRPQLPAGWSRARLERVRVGASTFDVEVTRERSGGPCTPDSEEPRRTTTTVSLALHDGPSLDVDLAPWFPPHSRLLSASVAADGADPAPIALQLDDAPSGARTCLVPARRLEGSLRVVFHVEEGPVLELPTDAPRPDASARHPRLLDRLVDAEGVTFRLALPPGEPARLPLWCDCDFELEGAALDGSTLVLPAHVDGGWSRHDVRVRTALA